MYYPGSEVGSGEPNIETPSVVSENPVTIPQFALLYTILLGEAFQYFRKTDLVKEIYPTLVRVAGWYKRHEDAAGLVLLTEGVTDPATYAANSRIPFLMAGGPTNAVGADLIVARAAAPAVVATRSFDSRWRWTPGGEAVRRAAGADFALVASYGPPAVPPTAPAIVPGTTRVADVTTLLYYDPVGMFEVTGTELLKIARRLAAPADASAGPVYLQPQVDAAKIEAARTYRVAVPVAAISPFTAMVQLAPRRYLLTDLVVSDALERYLAAP